MPPQNSESVFTPTPIPTTEQKCPWYQPLCKVTPLSKYLALVLFILLPFVGGYVGYRLAVEKMAELPLSAEVKSEGEKSQDNHDTNDLLTSYTKDSRYKTDGTFVYLFDDIDPLDDDATIVKYKIEGADPKTFEPKIVTNYPISQGNTFQGTAVPLKTLIRHK